MSPAIARRLLKLKASLPQAAWEKTRQTYAYARANGLSPEFAIAMAETSASTRPEEASLRK